VIEISLKLPYSAYVKDIISKWEVVSLETHMQVFTFKVKQSIIFHCLFDGNGCVRN
jgi:hypothetical protein